MVNLYPMVAMMSLSMRTDDDDGERRGASEEEEKDTDFSCVSLVCLGYPRYVLVRT